MKRIKKVVASALAASMMLSFAGCDKAGSQVKDAAAEVAESVKGLDIDDLIDEADLDDDEEDAIAAQAYDLGSGDRADVIEAIFDTMTYTVDNGSFDGSTKSKKASIDVTFTVVDYEAIIDEDPEDADEFVDMIAESDATTDLTTTLKFKLHGEDWNLDNLDDVLDDVFAPIYEAEYPFESSYTQMIDYTYWWNADSAEYDGIGYYEGNTTCLELDIIPLDEYTSTDWEFYFEVYNNDGTSLIYTSDEKYDCGSFIEAYAYADDMGLSSFDPDTYRIVFYDTTGAEICEGTAVVED